MTCDTVTPRLEALIAGRTDEETARALRAHLAACPACAAAHAALLPYGPDETTLRRLQRALDQASRPSLPPVLRRNGLAAAVAAAILLLALGLSPETLPAHLPTRQHPTGPRLHDSIRPDPRAAPQLAFVSSRTGQRPR